VAIGMSISAGIEPARVGRDILGVCIADMTRAEALALIHHAILARRHLKVAFCNAHTANTAHDDAMARAALARFTVLPDGVGVDMASKLLFGAPFRANLNGTDFVPDVLAHAPRPLSVALIGGRPGVAARAAERLAALGSGHGIGPILDGFAGPEAEARFLAALEAKPADVILVAMGNPRQELWIDARLTGDHGAVAIGVGALFDFLAGEVSRASIHGRR
jgi:exopolysaccharide biosynthesis WecB/TagA/CpsF family protein